MNIQAFCRERRGGLSRLAAEIKAPAQSVWQWAAGVRVVPSERCPAIEKATAGAVACEELRKDLKWVRVPDPGWPWHPAGRPLLDLTCESTDREGEAANT